MSAVMVHIPGDSVRASATGALDAYDGARRSGMPPNNVTRACTDGSSPAERLLLYLESVRPRGVGTPSFALVVAYRLFGPWDAAQLAVAAFELAAAHPSLLSRCAGSPAALPSSVLASELVDQRPISLKEGQTDSSAIAEYLSARVVEPLPLTRPVLFRISVGELDERDHVLCFAVHCCAADGTALAFLVEELAARYAKQLGPPGTEPPPQAPSWQAPPVESVTDAADSVSNSAPAFEYWRQKLRGATLPPKTSLSFSVPVQASADSAEVERRLSLETSAALRRLSVRMHVTPFVLGLAAWMGWLRQHCGAGDVLVPTITLARRTEHEERAIGSFLDMLLLRPRITKDATLADLIGPVHEEVLDALEHELPLASLLEQMPALCDLLSDRRMLLLPFQALPEPAPPLPHFGTCSAELLARCVSQNAGFSLPFDGLLSMKWTGSRYLFALEYRTAMLSADAAEALLDAFAWWLRDKAAGDL